MAEPERTRMSIQTYERKKKKHRKRHHHHRRHKSDLSKINFDLPGVVHVVIEPVVQKVLQCVVGEHTTSEKPWKKIQKRLLQEHLEAEELKPEYLPFYKYKQDIINYPDDEMLVGYIPDEVREFDEFYFCITPKGFEAIVELIEKIEEAQKARLNNTTSKSVRPWNSLGSEYDVEENIPQNTRSLYKIEYEAEYPIMIPDVKFRLRLVQNSRDGYMELTVPSRITISNIGRIRVDIGVQAAPPVTNSEAQTLCGYSKNIWTQYNYTYDDPLLASNKEFIKMFKDFVDSSYDHIADKLFVNNSINLFSDDYTNLIANKTEIMTIFLSQEYMSFKDIEKCKDKMISAIDWHPLWTGVVAIGYANLSPRWYRKFTGRTCEEFIEEAVFGSNPVLIWSFNDGLSPKLLLETTSEVNCLAFCKHDPNILVGGCVNGSIVVWDIRNKIEKVEEEEILTSAQQLYRTLMFSMMKWMKNTKNISVVPITAVTELQYTHVGNVTSIVWIHPNYRLTEMGHFEQIEDPEHNYSLQFISTGSDGCIKFWDLRQKPIISVGDYKPQRKSRRLKRRPSALTMDVSPFRVLNRRFKPHYQINIILPKQTTPCPIGSISIQHNLEAPEEVDPNYTTENIIERRIFRPIFKNLPNVPNTEFTAGSYLGDFLLGSFEGYDFLSGDVVTKETCKIVNLAKYHDGPVLYIGRHPILSDVYLTIGGKVFAIWKESLKGKPILWRRSEHKYTHGNWSSKPCGFRLNRSDGNREVWDLFFRSDTYYLDNAYSGKALLDGMVHMLPLPNKSVVGLADENGSFRLILVKSLRFNAVDDIAFIDRLFNNNAKRKVEFEKWQKNWTNTHTSWIQEQQEEALAEQLRKKEEKVLEKLMEEELKSQEASNAAKRAAAKLRPPPGHYDEWAHEQWIIKEQERMGNVLLHMKRLEKDTLVTQQAPLKKLEAEAEKRLYKQKQRLQRADDIFKETITMLFPDIADSGKHEEDSGLKLSKEEMTTAMKGYYEAYKEIQLECNEYIKDRPYSYAFNWEEVLQASWDKKKSHDFRFVKSHKTKRKAKSEMVNFNILETSDEGSNIKAASSINDPDELIGRSSSGPRISKLAGSFKRSVVKFRDSQIE